MTTLEEFKAAAPGYVAAGAEWLDANEPGWEGRVDLAKLDLANACRCVLGQVMPEHDYAETMGRLHEAVRKYGLESVPGGLAHQWAVERGFNAPEELVGRYTRDFSAFRILDELWIAVVKERHDSGTLSG